MLQMEVNRSLHVDKITGINRKTIFSACLVDFNVLLQKDLSSFTGHRVLTPASPSSKQCEGRYRKHTCMNN
jgi:hypothetical protein